MKACSISLLVAAALTGAMIVTGCSSSANQETSDPGLGSAAIADPNVLAR